MKDHFSYPIAFACLKKMCQFLRIFDLFLEGLLFQLCSLMYLGVFAAEIIEFDLSEEDGSFPQQRIVPKSTQMLKSSISEQLF